jgi:soluble lytic murein transglycosylase
MTAMARPVALALCLASALSCSLGEPRDPAAAVQAAEADALARIEARLARMHTGLGPAERSATATAIADEAAHNDLPVELILAVMHTESAFHNFARSSVGALGLMQVMPATGEMLARQHGLDWNGPETLFDPVANVRLGCRYLAFLRARYGSLDAALAAYNWGPSAIDRRLARGNGLPRKYPTQVLAQLASQSPAIPASR